MGAIISSLLPNVKSEEIQLDRQLPFRFLDLPAELRAMTYDLILPDSTDITLSYKFQPYPLRLGESQRVTGDISGPRRYYRERVSTSEDNIRTTVSLMKACQITHAELAPRLYHILRFVAHPASVADVFRASLHSSTMQVIQELDFIDYPYARCYGEKAEKQKVQTVVASFMGLRTLRWGGIDISADPHTKGTMWKPQELRKLAMVIKSSALLRKAFYAPPSQYQRYTSVRFTAAHGNAEPSELELVVNDEYQKWMDKNKERRDQKKASASA